MPSCAMKGCGKYYEDGSNEDCYHHPGAPIFHDALKGYSCCDKKVVDFDAFLKVFNTNKIPGCTVGKHSDVAPTIVVPKKVPATSSPPETVVNETEPLPKSEIYNLSEISLKPKEEEKIPEHELFDAETAIINEGSKCKRPGCEKLFKDEQSRKEECIFHKGAPIFHDGSKGWSCCKRRVVEFDDFLKIKGCTEGVHRFTEVSNIKGKVSVDCRRDWYQTPDKVFLSIFAKKVDKDSLNVVFSDSRIEVDIKFLDGSIHSYHTDLFQPIKKEECSFKVLSTKIEFVLVKANGVSWADICPNSDLKSWTTFGLQGGTGGSVGAKEAVIAGDAPLHILKNKN